MTLNRRLLLAVTAALLISGCGQSVALRSPGAGSELQARQTGSGILRTGGNDVKLLVDGEAIFDAMEADILRAKHSVQIHAYQLGGKTGMRLVDALIGRAKAGVQTQVIVDPAHGGGGSGKRMILEVLQKLSEAGIPVRDFNLKAMPKGPTWLSRLGAIDHSKIVVVDGRVAYLGGMNFYDHGALNHDYMVRIDGKAARLLGELNNADWTLSGPAEGLVKLPAVSEAASETTTDGLFGHTVEIAQTSPRARNVRELVTGYIGRAQKKVWIEMLMMDDDAILDALVAAKARGVDTRVVLDPMDWGNHVPELEKVPFDGIPNWAGVKKLLEAGVPVSWYKRRAQGENLHAKITMIDDRYLLVGSSNYTYRALDINRETTAALDAPKVASEFGAVFLRDEAAGTRVKGLTRIQSRLASLFDLVKRGVYKDN